MLAEYFPASKAKLDADLAASLAMVPDGKKQDAGVSIGAAAADRMIASRVGDGRNDASIVYSKPAAPGIWQPPASGMALPWLGFVKPVVDVAPVALDGPDPLTSAAYATDYNEVRKVGGAIDVAADRAHGRADRDRPVLRGQPGPDLPGGAVRPARR